MKYCFFTIPALIAALCCILTPRTTTVVDAYLHGQRLSILRAPYIIYGYVEVMNGDQITGLIIDENRLLVHARFCQNKKTKRFFPGVGTFSYYLQRNPYYLYWNVTRTEIDPSKTLCIIHVGAKPIQFNERVQRAVLVDLDAPKLNPGTPLFVAGYGMSEDGPYVGKTYALNYAKGTVDASGRSASSVQMALKYKGKAYVLDETHLGSVVWDPYMDVVLGLVDIAKSNSSTTTPVLLLSQFRRWVEKSIGKW